MIAVLITRLYRINTFGDLGTGCVEFRAFDTRANCIAGKALEAKVGSPELAGEFGFELCDNAFEVRCVIPDGTICEWVAVPV